MLVTLLGLGGGAGTVTAEALSALLQADAVLGSPRLLDSLNALQMPDGASVFWTASSSRTASVSRTVCAPWPASVPRIPEIRPAAIAEALAEHDWARPCVVYSGDTGFHSGAAALIPLLEARNLPFRVLPGLSSVQLLSARLGRPWQGWRLATAHGVDCDPVPEVCHGAPVFFLTGPGDPAALCVRLTEAGLGDLPVTIGENLSLPGERLTRTTAAEAARGTFAPLSVLLAEAAPAAPAFSQSSQPPAAPALSQSSQPSAAPALSQSSQPPKAPAPSHGLHSPAAPASPYSPRSPGIPDDAFLRGDVPMTKQMVRAAALALLAVRPDDILWDIGAGTGSVSVELALAARSGRVYAVERREAARDLIAANRARFGAWNLSLAGYEAPEDLAPLPAPDAVFLGGTGGRLVPILDAVLSKNPAARLCIASVTVETLAAAMEALTVRGLDAEAVQIAVSRTGASGGTLHLLRAENPVFLISTRRAGNS